MKKTLNKIADIIGWIYGYGIMISLFIGGLSFLGYVAALIIGGEGANAICVFIYKTIYPWLIIATSVIVLLGILKMYLKGEVALVSKKKEKSPPKTDTADKKD